MHLTVVSKDSEFKRTKIPLRIKVKRHLTAGTNQEQLKSNKRKKKSRNNEEIRNIFAIPCPIIPHTKPTDPYNTPWIHMLQSIKKRKIHS